MKVSLSFGHVSWALLSLLLLCLAGPSNAQTDHEKIQTIESMIAGFATDFKVKEIDASSARKGIGDKNTLFLDVRTPKEISVSKIPGAISKDDFEKKPENYKDKNIIAYCTIGYRSAKYVEEWNKRGYHMSNLRGSLLLWSHANGELIDSSGKPTHRIHVYGKKWNLVSDAYEAVY